MGSMFPATQITNVARGERPSQLPTCHWPGCDGVERQRATEQFTEDLSLHAEDHVPTAHALASQATAFGGESTSELMPQGPFASSVGVGRAEPEWAAKNKVTEICGKDGLHASGTTTDAPIELPKVRAYA